MCIYCLDFPGTTLSNFQKNDVNSAAQDLSRGNQGLDKDLLVKKCGDVAGAKCDKMPSFAYPGDDYEKSATITCDINPAFKYSDVFGVSTLVMDSSCPSNRLAKFEVLQNMDDPDNGCVPVEMEIQRSATDCCNQEVTETHYLTITSLPPKFTQEDGSLDATYECDANIHPTISGEPSFEAGCKDAFIDVDAEDVSSFDASTCVTTVTRTFTAKQDMCDTLV